MSSTTNISASYDFTSHYDSSGATQQGNVSVTCQARLYRASNPCYTILNAFMTGTGLTVSENGALINDTPTKRGVFIESIVSAIAFTNLDDTGGGFVDQYAPVTTNGSGAITSSTSFNIGASASAGSGGLGVGPSFSLEQGASNSETVADFTVAPMHISNGIGVAYNLSMGTAGRYIGPKSLVETDWGFLLNAEWQLGEIPLAAKSSVGILTQAVYMIPSTFTGTGTVEFQVKAVLQDVELSGRKIKSKPKTVDPDPVQLSVDFSQV